MDTIDTIQLSQGCDSATQRADFSLDDEPRVANVLVRLWHYCHALAAKRRSRLSLGKLSAEQLADIGLTEAEARNEAAVPFWR